MGIRVLIVDEDKTFVKGINYALEQDNYIVDNIYKAKDLVDNLNMIVENEYSIVLLDIAISDYNGLKLCQDIRTVSKVPIVVITEKRDSIKKILAFEYGADDYITKPFNNLELKARMMAILRRVDYEATDSTTNVLKIGDFEINTLGRKVLVKDKEINLTGKEFDLFYVLVSNPGKVFSREELLELVWGYEYYGDYRTIDVHIRRIREKIEEDPKNAEYIMTKWGEGYYYHIPSI